MYSPQVVAKLVVIQCRTNVFIRVLEGGSIQNDLSSSIDISEPTIVYLHNIRVIRGLSRKLERLRIPHVI